MMDGTTEGVTEPDGDQGISEASLPPIPVLVAVEIRLYREGLVQSLARHTGLQIVGTAADAGEAIEALQQHPPQVMLLDLGMEGSASLVREARDVAPQTRIVALGVRETERNVLLCAEAGISGYVPRDGTLAEVVAVVESAARGELRCSARMAAALFRRIEALAGAQPPGVDDASLTRREREVVELLDEGASNKEISRRLHIELSTVKNHVHNILTKLQVSRRGAITARARGHEQDFG